MLFVFKFIRHIFDQTINLADGRLDRVGDSNIVHMKKNCISDFATTVMNDLLRGVWADIIRNGIKRAAGEPSGKNTTDPAKLAHMAPP
ncbi:hypothetical protein QU42_19440 [Bradyrhizobium sp. UASWS1016]|nr:hypothetical protein QU42_19440 [Bradyrhizobium sp. UASWS1016]